MRHPTKLFSSASSHLELIGKKEKRKPMARSMEKVDVDAVLDRVRLHGLP
jgi:hypothetical protein